MTDWDICDFKSLIEFLRKREYLYNRSHENYKTYTVIKECTEFGQSLKPPKTSRTVLDKITALRKDITLAKQIIEDDCSKYKINDLGKFRENVIECSFMYSALFSRTEDFIQIKLNQFFNKGLKRKLDDNKLLCDKKPKIEVEITEFSSGIDYNLGNNEYYYTEIQTIKENQDENQDETKDDSINEIKFKIDSHDYDDEIHDLDEIQESDEKDDEVEFELNTLGLKNNLDEENYSQISENELIDPYKILYFECTDEIAQEDEIITLKVIKFLRNKPYYYKKEMGLYKDKKFQEKELTTFGKTFTPAMTGERLMKIIKYIIKKFYSSIDKPENIKWCWFDECKFLVKNYDNLTNLHRNKLMYPTVNIEELYKTRVEDPKLLIDIITFIEDNPCFYDENDEYFHNWDRKNRMKQRFKSILQHSYNENDISKMLDWMLKRVNSQIKKNYIIDSENSMESVEKVTLNNTNNYRYLPKTICPDKSVKKFTNEKVSYSVSSVQCNLPEELWEEKIKNLNLNNRDCKCVEEILELFSSNNEKSIDEPSSENILEENEIDIGDGYYLENDEDIAIGNYLIQPDYPDFSDYSSDDGLTEIPFPEIIPKIKKKRLPNGKIPCEDCDELFDNRVQLNGHEKTHGEKSLVCYKCGKINKYYRKLRMHENNCNPEDNKVCYECQLTFKSHLNFYDHNNQYHSKSNPYICVCRQAFTSYNKIITHLNKSDCGAIDDCILPEYVSKDFIKGFLEQKYVDEDEFVKTMEKTKFWCRICSRNFVRNDVYMKHFTRQFHLSSQKEWLKKYNIDEVFACDFCNKGDEPTKFKSLYELVTHRHGTHHKCTLTQFFEEMENLAKNNRNIPELPSDLSHVALECRICKIKYSMKFFTNHFRSKQHKKCERNWIINHNLRSFTCETCSLDFEDLIDYLEHRYAIHLEWPTNKVIKLLEGIDIETIGKKCYKYYCSICDYKTNNKKFYNRHKMNHGSCYRCSCGKSFRAFPRLEHHKLKNKCEVE